MTLDSINAIAQTLGVVALIVSLLFVAYQLRQNAKHTRAQIQSARVDRLMAQMIGFSDADKCAAYIRGNGREPTPEAIQDRQFYMQCLAQLGVMTDVFHQHQDGLLNDEQFAGVTETYRRWLAEPGFRRIVLDFKAMTIKRSPAGCARGRQRGQAGRLAGRGDTMDVYGLLIGTAQIATAIAGFGAVATSLAARGEEAWPDATRMVILLSFSLAVAVGALMPGALTLFRLPDEWVWRGSAVVSLVVALGSLPRQLARVRRAVRGGVSRLTVLLPAKPV